MFLLENDDRLIVAGMSRPNEHMYNRAVVMMMMMMMRVVQSRGD